MSSVITQAEGRVLLPGIRWETYERLLQELEARRIRLTYDRGQLEIMTLSPRHEWWKKLLGRLLETATEVRGVPIRSGGGPTWKRRDLQRGLEPDDCYWIQNEAHTRSRGDVDLAKDPPPDLALETEVTRSAPDRLAIFAALGVREVWRFDGERLSVHVLAAGGYGESQVSRALPWLDLEGLAAFLRRAGEVDETAWIRSFREWVAALP
jgi:Uma2 family endonuclease